jgi:competence protein ComEA
MTLKPTSFLKWIPTLAAMLLLAPPGAYAEPVNINTADASALAKALNGVGPSKAKAIVAYRDKNGPFKSVDQLAMVEGITQKLIDRNRADIKLGGDKPGGGAAPATPSPAKTPKAGS